LAVAAEGERKHVTAPARAGLYLEDLYVEPEWRGRGLGRRLFIHVVKVAAARGCGSVSWSVLNWNEPAMRFYRSLGAERVDDDVTFRLRGGALDRIAGEDS